MVNRFNYDADVESMCLLESGEWVQYDDYAKLEAQLAAYREVINGFWGQNWESCLPIDHDLRSVF
jgi:hypothetical protein